MRQQLYLRAIQTIPRLQIIYGNYRTHVVSMPLAYPVSGQRPFVKVIKTEEKGSDVNLATHLLLDGMDHLYECAVVISGDSDLRTPVQVVRTRLCRTIGVLNPQQEPAMALKREATFYKQIRESALQKTIG